LLVGSQAKVSLGQFIYDNVIDDAILCKEEKDGGAILPSAARSLTIAPLMVYNNRCGHDR
jgi:hypothetical protein